MHYVCLGLIILNKYNENRLASISGAVANYAPRSTTPLTESSSSSMNVWLISLVSFMWSIDFFNDLTYLFSSLEFPGAINWTVVQLSGRQSTSIYCPGARWRVNASWVVDISSSNILFRWVIFTCLSMFKDGSTPLNEIWCFPRHFHGFDRNEALLSSSDRKELSVYNISLSSTCIITIAHSEVLLLSNKRHGSSCDCNSLSDLTWWSKIVRYQCRFSSGVPYRGLNFLSN